MKSKIIFSLIVVFSILQYIQGVKGQDTETQIKEGYQDSESVKGSKATNVFSICGTGVHYWNDPANWSLGHIPTATEDVLIDGANCSVTCHVSANATCHDLHVNIETVCYLKIHGATLTVNGDAYIYGSLEMDNINSKLVVMGNMQFLHYGTSAAIANISSDGAVIEVYGDWLIDTPINYLDFSHGTVKMKGSNSSYISIYDYGFEFNNLSLEKSGGATVQTCTSAFHQRLVINNDFYIGANTHFYCFSKGPKLRGNFTYAGTFDIQGSQGTGATIFKGANQSITKTGSGSGSFGWLTINSTGTTTVNSGNLTINGDFTIESGVFAPGNHTVYVGGDWINNVGEWAFDETGSRVVFNGNGGHQYTTSEIFDVLEIDKPSAALRIENGNTVTCSVYDWSSGAFDVLNGTFTANDLYDDGIFGSYYLNPGAYINLYQDNSHKIDLNGSITFSSGGEMHVYGGSTASAWPGGYVNATLNMNGGGLLYLHDRGVNINDWSYLTFTSSITNGTIKLGGHLYCQRSDFNPTSGQVVMCGPNDAIIQMAEGSLYNLIIQKSSKGVLGNQGGNTKSNTVTLGYDLYITNDLTINSGTLVADEFNIYVGGDWIDSSPGNGFDGGTGTVIFNGSGFQKCSSETFNELELNNSGIGLSLNSSVNVTCSLFDWTEGELQLSENSTFTALDLKDNGIYGNYSLYDGSHLILHQDNSQKIDMNCSMAIDDGAEVTVYGGSTISEWPGTGSASVIINGVLDIHDHSIRIKDNSAPLTLIFNGKIKTGGSFICNDDTFNPTDGTVEINGPYIIGRNISMVNGSSIYNLTINLNAKKGDNGDEKSNYVTLYNDLYITNDLSINGGKLNTSNYDIYIQGDWNDNVANGFGPGTGKVVFNGSAGHQYCSSETFNILEVNKSSGAFRVENGNNVECAVYDWTSGAIDILSGSFTANDLADNGIYGSYYTNTGGEIHLHQDASHRIDLDGNLTFSGGGEIHVYGGSTDSFWPYTENASLNMSGGILDFHDKGIQIAESTSWSFSHNITGGTIRTAGNFYSSRADFTPTAGTVEMYGGGNLSVGDGSTLYNLVINGAMPTNKEDGSKDGTVFLLNDLILTNDLTIQGGTLNTNTLDIYIGGDWGNLAGEQAFEEMTGKVVFNGSEGHQYCSNEIFNTLEVNKASGAFRVDGSDVECAVYDWNDGVVDVLSGSFTANDLADNGIYGAYYLNSGGVINLTNDGYVDLNGELHIFGGTMNIYGGMDDSYWSFGGDALIVMSDGVLDFHDRGIRIYNSSTYSLTENITGGTIRTSRSFISQRSDFTPSAGTFELYGATDYNISQVTGSTLYNLRINKSSKNGKPENTLNPVISQRSKDTLSSGMKSNQILLFSDFTVTNDLSIDDGTLSAGLHTLTVSKNIYVYNGGTLSLTGGSELKMSNSGNINVNSGGTFTTVGTESNYAHITHNNTGYYRFKINSGGTLSAKYTLFEFIHEYGLYFYAGSVLDPAYSLDYCTFQNVQQSSYASDITFDNEQTVTCTGVSFPDNPGYNVWKSVNAGNVTFVDATGDYAGPDYEYDIYNRIQWSGFDYYVDLTVMLEGAYNGTSLSTALNNSGLLPLTQPFGSDPQADWYYTGTESVAAIPDNVVDWVLVQLRDATDAASANGSTVVAQQAAFLLNDGSIVDLDGTSALSFNHLISQSLFVTVYQRNHLGIISANPLVIAGDTYSYDFSTSAGQAYNNGQKQIATGVWGMVAGDANGDGTVTSGDITLWKADAGKNGYLRCDFNLDSQVCNMDKNDCSAVNINYSSQIPE